MPTQNPSGAIRVLPLLVLLALALPACVYRPNIQQGNLLDTTDVDQVAVGMTRSQVRYLLGTPMVSDPFDPQRWDYVYTFREGRNPTLDRAHFVVHFEGDKVIRVEKLDQPEQSPAQKQIERAKKEHKKSQAESATPPSDAAPPAPVQSPPPAGNASGQPPGDT